jgi:hypothetical protein
MSTELQTITEQNIKEAFENIQNNRNVLSVGILHDNVFINVENKITLALSSVALHSMKSRFGLTFMGLHVYEKTIVFSFKKI